MSAAVVLRMSGGVCHSAGISLGAVSPIPIRIEAAEALLTHGESISDEVIEECGRLAAEASSPIDDIRASAEYRQLMCADLTKRLIRQALSRGE